ncbi:MAG: hypothetical protein JKY56_27030 [Kofleriaceae bacterium]|nr:hypothetical protein [Kofleriaceae bacterium]
MARYQLVTGVAAALLAATGCTQILGLDEVGVSETKVDAASSVDAAEVADATVADAMNPDASTRFVCSDVEISEPIGSSDINTEALADTVVLSCNSKLAAPDQLYKWTAAVTDYYIFDTAGSSFDTVLGLIDECDGTELACNNNIGQLATSEIVARVPRDESRLIVVDGFAGDQGIGMLNINRVSCPDTDLQSLEGPITLTTLGFGDDQTTSRCGGSGEEDRSYHWVAPRDGLFAFQARADGFRPIVSIQNGPQCSDTELGCSKATDEERLSEVVRRLTKDQVVSISVDGVNGAGEFTLDIVDRSASACPQSAYSNSASELFTTRTMSPSCGFPELYGEFNVVIQPGDRTYSYAAGPVLQGCSSGCSFEINSQVPFVVSLLDQDDCGGNEIQCIQSVFNVANNRHEAELQIQDTPDAQNLTIIISSQDDRANTFSIQQGCSAVC